jgi:raffinose/stachyose/melibiose transport system permease protein
MRTSSRDLSLQKADQSSVSLPQLVAYPKIRQISKHALLLLYAIIIVAPISTALWATFKTTAELYQYPLSLPETWSLNNYVQLFASENMAVYFGNSLLVTVVSVAFILFLGSMETYAIVRLPRIGGSLLFSFLTLGMMVPVQVNMIPTYLEMEKFGLLNSHIGLIIVNIATLLPICVFILTGFMKTIPKGLFEAARMDGASHWQIYTRVVLPLSKPSLTAAGIFCGVIVWNDLLFPLLFLKEPALKTLPVALLQFQGEYLTNYPMIFAGVMIASLPIIILYVFLQRYFIQGMTAGAIKG